MKSKRTRGAIRLACAAMTGALLWTAWEHRGSPLTVAVSVIMAAMWGVVAFPWSWALGKKGAVKE